MKLTRFAAAAGLLIAAALGGVAVAGPANAYPAGQAPVAQINETLFPPPGGVVTVNVQKTTPGPLTMQIFSAPVTIGHGTTGADGNGTVSGKIPDGYSGNHTILVIGAGGEPFYFNITITAVASGGGGSGSGGGSSSGGGLANTGAAVTGIGILGGILVAGGVFFVAAGRRRTTADDTPSA